MDNTNFRLKLSMDLSDDFKILMDKANNLVSELNDTLLEIGKLNIKIKINE